MRRRLTKPTTKWGYCAECEEPKEISELIKCKKRGCNEWMCRDCLVFGMCPSCAIEEHEKEINPNTPVITKVFLNGNMATIVTSDRVRHRPIEVDSKQLQLLQLAEETSRGRGKRERSEDAYRAIGWMS